MRKKNNDNVGGSGRKTRFKDVSNVHERSRKRLLVEDEMAETAVSQTIRGKRAKKALETCTLPNDCEDKITREKENYELTSCDDDNANEPHLGNFEASVLPNGAILLECEDDISIKTKIYQLNTNLVLSLDDDVASSLPPPGTMEPGTNEISPLELTLPHNAFHDDDCFEENISDTSEVDDPDYEEEEENEDEEEWEDEEVEEEEMEQKSATVKKIFKTKKKSTAKYNLKLNTCKDPYEFNDDGNRDLEDDDESNAILTQVTKNKTDQRKWDRLSACPYCKYVGTGKLDLHLEAKHKDEEDVKLLLKYKKTPKVKGEDKKNPKVKGKEQLEDKI